ncbi:MAG: glycoside hydrolase, partial [Bacteroidaceae bacterium]|nr:glycoside hydrolase [Bacteroidaceae bacterium]
MKKILLFAIVWLFSLGVNAQGFQLNSKGYFQNQGVSVMAFDDVYPEGHQSGVCLIMNGNRIATNGDLRLEATPGQWQPLPKQLKRTVAGNSITTSLVYPDSSKHETGFNPIIYPDLHLSYSVKVEADGDDIIVTLDLDQPVPEEFLGKVGFNFEFFPGSLFGKPWIMDQKSGIYPQQPNAPLEFAKSNMEHIGDFHRAGRSRVDLEHLLGKDGEYNPIIADDIIAAPYAVGNKFTSRPDDALNRVTIETITDTPLKLYDGRMNHNNGWFVLRSEVPAGKTKGAVKWRISPTISPDWIYKPVVQTSQVGYLPLQPKTALVELDSRDTPLTEAKLVKMTAKGDSLVRVIKPEPWGDFLRYKYLEIDFSDV